LITRVSVARNGRALALLSAFFCGCAASTTSKATVANPAAPAQPQTLAERFFRGPPLDEAAKRVKQGGVAASIAYLEGELSAMIAFSPLFAHGTAIALQSAPDREGALRLISARKQLRSSDRAAVMASTLKAWERCRRCRVSEASDEQSQGLYPVHFPLELQAELRKTVRDLHHSLGQASIFLGACDGADLLVAVDDGQKKIIALRVLPKDKAPVAVTSDGTATLQLSAAQRDTVALVSGVQRWLPTSFERQKLGSVEIKVSAPGFFAVSFLRKLPSGGRTYRSHFVLVAKRQ